MTNIAWALDNDPSFCSNVKQVVVMGGAVDVPGNVFNQPNHDGSAEWNVYWDAPAFHRALNSPLRIVLFPLDATNTVPIARDFVGASAPKTTSSPPSLLAECSFDYYAWDALTTAFAVRPDICKLEEIPITIVLDAPQE
eukprot:CAMPEP_0172152244 /NCGR_PEP_ID=MMETSP1050-20130122/725_1 /TAXON_ID=233186 /ORGANISM="Cryptomonas curvata, Strain CCAP979/52" /LENGTH=138 /DNA_ID=CAMNT_0012820535 /DNA_START=287 /DNA_END=701 /DNA_ORIENTATION=-